MIRNDEKTARQIDRIPLDDTSVVVSMISIFHHEMETPGKAFPDEQKLYFNVGKCVG